MRTNATVLLICLIGCFAACTDETNDSFSKAEKIAASNKDTTTKPMNVLDEQIKVFGKVFELGGTGAHNPLAGAINYQELIQKMDLPSAQKKLLYEQYKIYDLSLDPRKKDSLKLMVDKMLTNALEKSRSKQ